MNGTATQLRQFKRRLKEIEETLEGCNPDQDQDIIKGLLVEIDEMSLIARSNLKELQRARLKVVR